MKPGPSSQSETASQAMIPHDPGLRNLALALDPKQILPLFQETSHLPDGAASCRIEYIRYKPGTNCILLYEVSLDEGSRSMHKPRKVWCYAKLFAADRVPRGSDELLLSRYDEDRQMALAVFPRDLQMPALRLAMTPNQAASLLKGAMGSSKHSRFHRDWSNWIPIRYKPERRCVMRGEYDTPDRSAAGESGRRFYARFYASSSAQRYAPWYRHFHALTGKRVRTPRCMGYSPKNRLLLLKNLSGAPLSSFFDGPEAELGRALDTASAALATWHGLTAPPGTPVLSPPARQLREYARVLEVLLPDQSLSPTALAEELAGKAPKSAPNCLLHGDFYYDQVLVSRHPLARFLDLDNLALGDPLIDVAGFCAQLRLGVHLGRLKSQPADWMCRRFLEGYQSASRGPIQDQRLQWHVAAQLLKLAIWPFRRFQDRWPERTRGLLTEAFEWGEGVQC